MLTITIEIFTTGWSDIVIGSHARSHQHKTDHLQL